MKLYIYLFFGLSTISLRAQKSPGAAVQPSTTVPTSILQIKSELEKSPNPILYTRDILKKRWKIDTIIVSRTRHFQAIADSLAYTGKEKKVYGPYGPAGNRFLVQLLSKAPNQFYHIRQIFIDTAVFRRRVADSLADAIIELHRDPSRRMRLAQQATERFGRTYRWSEHKKVYTNLVEALIRR